MSLAERCAVDFEGQDKSWGQKYFRDGRVQLLTTDRDGVAARVRGDSAACDVKIDWSFAREGMLQADCTCPNFQDGETCKHVWAVLVAADARGLGPKKGKRDLEIVDFDEDNYLADYDDEDDGFPVPQVGQAMAWAAPSPRRNGKTTGWKRQLAEAQARYDDVRRHDAAFTPCDKTREVWYVIDLATCMDVGNLVVSFYHRQTKLNGEFGKLKPLTVDRRNVDNSLPPSDRDLLRLLLASGEQSQGSQGTYYSRYSYYYDYDSRVSQVALRGDAYGLVLPKLCASGRLVWTLDSAQQEPETQGLRLAWDDGPAWRFQLCAEPNNAKKQWRLEGRFVRDGATPIPLKLPSLVLIDGLVLCEDRLARLDASGAAGWIHALRQSSQLVVPYRDRWDLLEQLWQTPARIDANLPENLRCEEIKLPPQGRMEVHSPAAGYKPTHLCADVEFCYEDKTAAVSDASAGIVDRERGRVLVRDRQKEQELLAFLAAQGARFDKSGKIGGHDLWFPQKLLPEMVAALVQAGWVVEAEGFRVRKPGEMRMSVTSGVDWFDLEGTCDFEGVSAKLPDLLAALRHGEKFVRLGDGTRGLLPQEWLDKFGTLANLGEAEDGHIRFRPSQALLLDALLAAQKEVSVDEQFAHIRSKLRSFAGIERRDEPHGFQGQLRDYQKDGLGWLHFLRDFRLGGCLADDMGLGKTIQVLALLQMRRTQPPQNGHRIPSLAVVPRSLVFNWIEEAQRFTPTLRVLDYTGPLRKESLKRIDEYDLVVTTYGTLHRDIAKLKDVRFDYAILDEAQAIKNAQSQRAKTCRLLQAEHRLAMTGTPVENHLGELWSLFEFLNPGMLGSSTAFQRISKRVVNESDDLQMLRRAMAPFLLRRTKAQVLTELPEKTEQTLHCDLEGRQQKLYRELKEYYRASLAKRIQQQGLAKTKIHVLEALLRLRQAALHPGLIDPQHVDQPSAKLDVLLEQIQAVLDAGHKALVFSQFTSFLSIVRRRLDAEKIVYEYLDGSTNHRKDHVDRFQNDPDCPLFLISLKAGGHGLNLTAADYVFILDPWWNPAVEAQAVDRAHRIGQTRPVSAYRLIARDTVEEKIVELQKSKRDLADAIISDDSNVLRNLTAEDLQMLLS